MQHHLRRTVAALVTAGTVSLYGTACTAQEETGPEAALASEASDAATDGTTSASPRTTEEEILVQYAAFWQALTPAAEAPAEKRRELLEPVATEPILSSMVKRFGEQERTGRGQYGAEVPRPTVISTSKDTATISDCQDGSSAGVLDRATGKKLVRGPDRNPLMASMSKGVDGVWRVRRVDYAKEGATC